MAEILQFDSASRHRELQTCQKVRSVSLYFKERESGKSVTSYLAGFPTFARLANVMAMHVGFDIAINGFSVLGRSMEDAVAKAQELCETKAVENIDVSDVLVHALSYGISQLRDWNVHVVIDEQVHSWDITSRSFRNWIRSSKQTCFYVKRHESQASENEKLGLSMRLLCFGLEDETIGRIVSNL